MSSWYKGGMIHRSGVVNIPCGVPIGVPPSDSAIAISGVQGTQSLCSRVPGGGMGARVPKICTSVLPSGSLATDSKSTEFTVHNGLLIQPCPAKRSTLAYNGVKMGKFHLIGHPKCSRIICFKPA